MATEYDKILIRSSLSDTGELPRTGDVSDSPDVIPYGMDQQPNPVVFFISNYTSNVGTALEAGQYNYIYLRGKSTLPGLVQSDLYLYWSDDANLNQPAKWTPNMLKTESGNNFVTVIAQAEGNIVVGAEPFVWVPPTPAKGTAFSLIAIAVESGSKPDFRGVNDFEDFVDNNLNVGWNKVTINKPTPPQAPPIWETTFQYSQNIAQSEMRFDILCKDIPTTCYLSFNTVKTAGGDPSPAIKLDKRVVDNSNASYGIISNVPADFKGNITFTLYGTDAPDGSSLNFRAYYVEKQQSGPSKTIPLASVTTTNRGIKTKSPAKQALAEAAH